MQNLASQKIKLTSILCFIFYILILYVYNSYIRNNRKKNISCGKMICQEIKNQIFYFQPTAKLFSKIQLLFISTITRRSVSIYKSPSEVIHGTCQLQVFLKTKLYCVLSFTSFMINHWEVSISLFQILLIRILFFCKLYTVVIKIFIKFRIHCDICYFKDK